MEQENQFVDGFTEACKREGYDAQTVIPDMSSYPEELRPALIAAAKLFIINQAANRTAEGIWKPDYNNFKQEKYFPVYDMEKTEENPSGFGFCVSYFVRAYSLVGSRLSYRTREISDHAGKQHEPLYRDLMFIP